MYPEGSIQSVVGSDWWVTNSDKSLCRGALISAFVPHVDQTPYTFEPIGRTEPEKHDTAELIAKPLNANSPLQQAQLPVAAMLLYHNEVWAAYRAKKRPCLVLGTKPPAVNKTLIKGKPNSQTAPTVIVAPYYGVGQNGKRSGYSETFVEAVRHCEYPQFFWDKLPEQKTTESILRLDHLQPIGTHYKSYVLTNYKLSEEGIEIIDTMLQWLLYGGVEEESMLMLYRSEIEEVMG